MKDRDQSAARIRAFIRWTTGTVVASAILTGACYLFPLTSSLSALALTGSLSLFIGLSIALPPLDPKDDWVPIHPRMEKDTNLVEAAERQPVSGKKRVRDELDSVEGIEFLPVHRRRMTGESSGLWTIFHPEIKHDEETHRITSSDRHGRKRIHLHDLHFPFSKKG